MRRALVIGSAASVWTDLDKVSAMMRETPPDFVIGVNRAALVFPVHRWASLHPELYFRNRGGPGWLEERRRVYPGLVPVLYGPSSKPRDGVVPIDSAGRGSSGYFGVEVALELGAERVALVGVPMTPEPHFDDPRPWDAATAHLKEWRRNRARLANVRSASGRTRDLLGHPRREWWLGTDTETTTHE